MTYLLAAALLSVSFCTPETALEDWMRLERADQISPSRDYEHDISLQGPLQVPLHAIFWLGLLACVILLWGFRQ